jgi:hypothetical protein
MYYREKPLQKEKVLQQFFPLSMQVRIQECKETRANLDSQELGRIKYFHTFSTV